MGRINRDQLEMCRRLMIPVAIIILLKISEANYEVFIISFLFFDFICPACSATVKYHASYKKKLYLIPLDIHRVRCQNEDCRKTHAIIPSFSVPGCSTGTRELDEFIDNRGKKQSVEEAGQCFIDAGMCVDYPESIHIRLKNYRSHIETIFPNESSEFYHLSYSSLILQLAGNVQSAVTALNFRCYEKGANPVLFSRANILFFDRNNLSPWVSHDITFEKPP